MEKHRPGRSGMRSIRQSSLHKLAALCTKPAGYVRTGTNKRLHAKEAACPWQGAEGQRSFVPRTEEGGQCTPTPKGQGNVSRVRWMGAQIPVPSFRSNGLHLPLPANWPSSSEKGPRPPGRGKSAGVRVSLLWLSPRPCWGAGGPPAPGRPLPLCPAWRLRGVSGKPQDWPLPPNPSRDAPEVWHPEAQKMALFRSPSPVPPHPQPHGCGGAGARRAGGVSSPWPS